MKDRHVLIAAVVLPLTAFGMGLMLLFVIGFLDGPGREPPRGPTSRSGHELTFIPAGHADAVARDRLSDAAYGVTRLGRTEEPFSSPLLQESRNGLFHCAVCELPLYPSGARVAADSGFLTFWRPYDDGHVRRRPADGDGAVACVRCFSHVGRVTSDAAQPAGERHEVNGLSLRFSATGG